MKFITRLLLILFTAISAYVTFTLTYSLANNSYQTVAFGTLGICFDILKCLLPATIISCFASREWGKLSATTLAYICLTSFSFYASTQLFDASTSRKIDEKVKSTVAYSTLQKQLDGYQISYDRLVALDRITQANKQYSVLIETTSAKMTALIETAHSNKTQSLADLAMTIIVSLLLELSVLACHITLSLNAPKNASKTVNKYAVNNDVSTCSEYKQSQAGQAATAKKRYKQNTLSDAEIVSIESALPDVNKTYRYLMSKYNINQSRAGKIRQQIEAKTKQEASNLIILPTTTKRAN